MKQKFIALCPSILYGVRIESVARGFHATAWNKGTCSELRSFAQSLNTHFHKHCLLPTVTAIMSQYNPPQPMLELERQNLERDLLGRMQQEFLDLKTKTNMQVTEVVKRAVREEIIRIEMERKGLPRGQESSKGDMEGCGVERDEAGRPGQIMPELAAINAKLDHMNTRLSALESFVKSNVKTAEPFREQLDERLRMMEQLMNAILTGTPQGKQFIAENFVLDSTKYQELLHNEAVRDEHIRTLSEGWRERAELQKQEDEERRRINRLRRLGREAAQAAREYSDTMSREKENQDFRLRQQRWLQEEQVRVASDVHQKGAGSSEFGSQLHRMIEGVENGPADDTREVQDEPEKEDAGGQSGREYGTDSKEPNSVLTYWKQYEQQVQNDGPLSFDAICWPMLVDPYELVDLAHLEAALEEFLLSPHHSQGLTAKKRINAALLRWHPDKGSWLLSRLSLSKDKESASVIMTAVAFSLASIRVRIDRG